MMTTTQSITVRKSNDRGHANHGWLESRHSFSFAGYHDREHMGFRSLRVINEDWIAPQGGFPTHPHRDMEIFTYVMEGAIEHSDSMGNGRQLLPGQIQLMSAGSGVTHSEFNPSPDQQLHLLQIWINPTRKGLTPSYTEWNAPEGAKDAAKLLLISPDGREGSAVIHAEAEVYKVRMQAGESVDHEVKEGRGVWLQVVRGNMNLSGMNLSVGDAGSTETPGILQMTADGPAEALLFDLG
ncbi:pirin family protein [Verrucomicrobia bacterium]|nr:pirin family protein [Verrucomicrobiota bacterium]